ncbi:MAG: GAF domain-containing protein [Tenuifilaceae bacterium]|jgi:hypothetical protein|nr:GAF domain-containing protein [Tenuifilaceae bacterium]
MKIFTSNSRFSYGILLIVLIISASGSLIALHNRITQAQTKTPLLAVVLMLVVIIIAILLFQQLSSYYRSLNKVSDELEQLKKTIRESRKQEEEEEAKAKVTEKVINIDYQTEAQNLIPTAKFESQSKFLEKLLSNIASKHEIVQAIAFVKASNTFEMVASYAYFSESEPPSFIEGETLPGQVAKNKVVLNLSEVPDDYITVLSGLGKGTPSNLLIIPVVNKEGESVAVIELASFSSFSEEKVKIFESLANTLSKHITSIGISTEE